MVFFQNYLEDPDELLALDAYAEFAKTSYTGIKELKDRIAHDKLISWIQDPKVVASHRRLYTNACWASAVSRRTPNCWRQCCTRDDPGKSGSELDSPGLPLT